MIHTSDLNKAYYKTGEVAEMVGVSPRTIQNYCMQGLIKDMISEKNRRHIAREDLIEFLKKNDLLIEDDMRCDAIYLRVSYYGNNIQQDLEKQYNEVLEKAIDYNPLRLKYYEDFGTELSNIRRGLKKLIKDIMDKKIRYLFVYHTNRLTELAYSYLKYICDLNGTVIVSLFEHDFGDVKKETDLVLNELDRKYKRNIDNQQTRQSSLLDMIDKYMILESFEQEQRDELNNSIKGNARTYHIVLDNTKINSADKIDLAQTTINPVQIFKTFNIKDNKDVVELYNHHLEKFIQFINLFTSSEMTVNQKRLLKQHIHEYYFAHLYVTNDMINDSSTMMLPNIKRQHYEKLNQFISYVIIHINQDIDSVKSEKDRNDLEYLRYTLNKMTDNLNDKKMQFDGITSLSQDPVFTNHDVVYNLSNVQQPHLNFLVTLNYVLSIADENSLIMIHGADFIDIDLYNCVKKDIHSYHNRGGRIVYDMNMVEDNKHHLIDKDNIIRTLYNECDNVEQEHLYKNMITF